jgi:pyruvate dehydrogenase E1 component
MATPTDRPDLASDIDPQETREWIESLASTLEREGVERAHFLLEQLVDHARRSGAHLPFEATTSYVNTIPVTQQPRVPGDPGIERRIRSLIRWNALAMVVNANRSSSELGGHIASFASAATLYDVGFNHFFRGPEAEHRRPASTRGPSSRAVSARSNCAPSVRKSMARGCPPIRTPT